MYYTGQPTQTSTGGAIGIIAAITSIAVTVIEAVRKLIKMIKERNNEPPKPMLPCNGNTVDMVYNDNTGTWVSRMPITHTSNPINCIGNINNGGNKMSEFQYDCFGQLGNYDLGNTNMYNRNLPYGYGYNPNKRDYVWQDKTLGQCPSTTEWTPFEARTSFDPVPWLKAANSYVNATMDPYYPYRNTQLWTKYDGVDPPKDDSYLKDPYAGILYKNLENHYERRQYNPYEPSRPFATYDPNSIRANDPAANPYGMTQEQINGIVNRTNFFKDYILNIKQMGAPNNIDDPYKLLGGPSYVGPDGQLHIRQVPQQLDFHPRREFLDDRFDKPYPTYGGEVFGRGMYPGLDFRTMNQPFAGYNRVLTGGIEDMYDSRQATDPIAPDILSIPFIRNEIERQQREQQMKTMRPTDPTAKFFSDSNSNTNKPGLLDPHQFANPYSKQLINQIDRSKLTLDPTCGMMLNDGSPDDKFAMLMNMTPNGMVNPMPMLNNMMGINPNANPLYNMNAMNANYNPVQNMTSVLGPNTHAGLMRQGAGALNVPTINTNPPMMNGMMGMNPNMNMYGMNPNYNMNQNNGMSNAMMMYGKTPQQMNLQYGMSQMQPQQMAHVPNNTGGPSLFSNEHMMQSMANYGKSPQPQQQMNPQQYQTMNMPNMNPNANMGNMNISGLFDNNLSQQQMNINSQPTMNDIFKDGEIGEQVAAHPVTDHPDAYKGMNDNQLLRTIIGMRDGLISTEDETKINVPKRTKTPDQLAAKFFSNFDAWDNRNKN